MLISGDNNVPAMPLNVSEVAHLRRLLAWMRCEWMLDEDMQRGFILGASESVRIGAADADRVSAIVEQRAKQINQCPAYVRQSVKMLTKAIRAHEKQAGVVEAPDPV